MGLEAVPPRSGPLRSLGINRPPTTSTIPDVVPLIVGPVLFATGCGDRGPTGARPAIPSAVTATVETDPVPHAGDAADDPAIWVHPRDPAMSVTLGSDKRGGLAVYDLAGRQVQYLAGGDFDNVDLRTGFLLGGRPVTIVTAGGVFVAQDGRNPGGNQNFRLVPWPEISRALTGRLGIRVGNNTTEGGSDAAFSAAIARQPGPRDRLADGGRLGGQRPDEDDHGEGLGVWSGR